MRVYDDQFNFNEIFVIIMVTSFILVKLLPRRFSKKVTLLILLYSIFIATIFDNIMGIQLINYYDINDTSVYSFYDVLLYLGYGPIGYFFIYIYDRFSIQKFGTLLYVFVWSLVALLVEYFSVIIGVFHYLNGYSTPYSFPIYLFVQGLLILFYHWVLKLEKYDEQAQTY